MAEHDLVAVGSEEAAQKFQAAARAIDADNVVVCRADPAVAYHNVTAGAAAVLAEEKRIKAELPAVNVEHLREIPQIAQGLLYLAIVAQAGSPSDVSSLLERASKVRRKMLAAAIAAMEAGIIAQHEVRAIQKGSGKRDMANDCVALAALFRKYDAQLQGRTAVTADDIEEASRVGSTLQTILKRRGVRKAPDQNDPQAQAEDDRDHMWTLLIERHELLWRVGAYLFGRDEVDEKVPALQSRVYAAKKPDPQPGAGGKPA